MPISNELDYKKHLNLIKQHKKLFLITALTIMTLTVIASYVLPKKYEAKCTVFIEKSLINEIVKGLAVTPSMEDKIKGLSYAMSSRPLLMKVINDLDLNLGKNANIDGMIAKFQKDTKVELKNDENLFTISYVSDNPRLSRDYVNTLVRRYIEENVSSSRAESYGASKFLSEEVAALKEKMDRADAEVNRFRRENASAVAADPAALEREITSAQQRVDEIQLRRAQLEAARSQLRKNNPARNRLMALERQLEEMRVAYTDNYPEVVRLKSEIDSARELASQSAGGSNLAAGEELERIDAELRALRTSESKQYGYIASAREMLRNIPAAKSTLEQLERERLSHKALYDQLVTRQGQSEFSNKMDVQDKGTTFRIVDPAVLPVKPTSPNRVALILIGIGGGLVAAFGLLLVVDYYDQSVKSLEPLKSIGVPVLVVIPKMFVPAEVKLQKSKDMRLYTASACYFSLILIVLLLEFLEVSALDTSLDPLLLKQYFTEAMSQLK